MWESDWLSHSKIIQYSVQLNSKNNEKKIEKRIPVSNSFALKI